ncbi:MAG: DUF348 domain-containing protein [Clostridia bacterium]|nr:DUF348 domain-containing protein [Clostridia bacterium]
MFFADKSTGFLQGGLKQVLGVTLVIGFLITGLAVAVKTVEVVDRDETITLKTVALTVDAALTLAGMELGPHDQVLPGPDRPVKEGMTIKILRAKPVELEVDGRRWVVRTVVSDVHELLAREGIQLAELDQVDAGQHRDGTKWIKVTRITEELLEERVEVPYETFRQPDNQLHQGQQRILVPGQNGVVLNKIRVVKADGVEVAREVVSSRVLAQPQKSVVAYGIGGNQTVAARQAPGNVKKVMTMEATAYTHTGNPTATGIYPYRGIVAVDPKVIPLGSKLYVEGYGYCEAQDTGGAIKGDRIDIFLDSRAECFEWGRRVVQVYLLE